MGSNFDLDEDLSAETIQKYESYWLEKWENESTYAIANHELLTAENKYYCLVMFPYPSGRIHMGHVRNYSIGDVFARFKRLNGFAVIHPMGWDSFGLPAENAAIKNKTAPAEWTFKNIDAMRAQLKRIALSYDWQREIFTCKPDYYRWNQQLFIKMLEKGWVYKKKAAINWCEKCNTVLANEQVDSHGNCWRHPDTPVINKELEQWFFKITDFAEELLDGHKELEGKWPERVLSMQKHWIGKSTGTEADFPLENSEGSLRIFTTRIDTVYGVSYMAVAPEHDLLNTIIKEPYKSDIVAFKKKVNAMSNIDRENPNNKEGVFTGLYALHPFTNERIPVYSANFVLPSYGTGAVMAVPAHDQRDFEFAQKYDLPIKAVIKVQGKDCKSQEEAITEPGTLFNSGKYNGLSSKQAKEKMAADLNEKGRGDTKIQFRLRDWLLSRQRYWGTPIPIIYCDDCGIVPVPEKDLPVVLPENVEFEESSSPLCSMPEFLNTTCPKCGKPAIRETDTMDTFVDSSWYFARYLSPKSDHEAVNKTLSKKALPIDQYIGGVEHATMHLLYSRYFSKVMSALDIIDCKEPFKNLLTQGMVIKDGAKMSKSLGNVVDPDMLVEKYGADTVRLFSLFAAPPNKDLEWSNTGVEGCFRFIKRLHRFLFKYLKAKQLKLLIESPHLTGDTKSDQLLRKTHQTIQGVTEDIERQSFNTGIAKLMELLNEMYSIFPVEEKSTEHPIEVISYAASMLLTLLNPYAPLFSLTILTEMGLKSEAGLSWPGFSPEIAAKSNMTIVFQVNGKLRAKLDFSKSESKENILSSGKDHEKIASYLKEKTLIKEIYVPKKLVNYVVK